MEANQFLGLVKFFRDESYLDKLISGCFYCKTPESYRLDKLEGVSDKFESCLFSYRTERSDSPIIVELNGEKVDGVVGVTIQKENDHDSWLHCWMSLRIPKDEESLEQLKNDIKRLKSEFGTYYAFIPANKLSAFVTLLNEISHQPLWCKEVVYSSDKNLWSPECKAAEYSYQREYRFGLGKCETSELSPLIINHDGGFHDFIIKSPEVKFESLDKEVIFFNLASA
jgi:hypothetical protein